jgi:hypothetical protein
VVLSQEGPGPELLAEKANTPALRAAADFRFDAFVNWDYVPFYRNKLKGWKNASLLIRQTLAEWSGESVDGKIVENGGPEALRQFLAALKSDGGFHLVYLASHQSPAGEWEFIDRQKIGWERLIDGLNLSPAPRRIVVWDACFAAAVPESWRSKLAAKGQILFASSAREPTFELILNRRQPVWFEKRFPREMAWIRDRFGEKWLRKDGRMSFLGFVWLQAFLETETPPQSPADWERFFRACEAKAASFRENANRKLSSNVHVN